MMSTAVTITMDIKSITFLICSQLIFVCSMSRDNTAPGLTQLLRQQNAARNYNDL